MRFTMSAAIGAPALTEERSGTFASTIQCPYHAWTYDLAVAGRRSAHGRRAPVSAWTITRSAVAVDLWDGHLFLNLGRTPRRSPTRSAGWTNSSVPGEWISFGWADGSSTTWRPTGS